MEVEPSKKPINKVLYIGCDLDDTLNHLTENFVSFVNQKQIFKKEYDFNQMESFNWAKFFGITFEEAHQLYLEFESLYIEKLEPMENAYNVLFNLKNEFNCKLYIITARSEKIRIQTENWLNLYYPNIFEGIEFGNNYDNDPNLIKRTKYEICKSKNINIIIDDRFDVVYDNRLIGILFERPWSRFKGYGYTFNDWSDVSFKNFFLKKIRTIMNCKPIIIGLSGKIGAGKDAIGDIIEKEFPFFFKTAFAYRLKETVATLTQADMKDLLTQEGKSIIPPSFTYSLGQLLQMVGEGLRNIIDKNIWINCVLENNDTIRKHLIITDVRYDNEIKSIENKGGIVLRTEGDPYLTRKNNYAKRNLNHDTETALDNYNFDFIIENNGTKGLREFIELNGLENLTEEQKEELNRLKNLSLDELRLKILFIMYPIILNQLYC